MPNHRPADNSIISPAAGLLLTAILSLFAVAPLLYPGFIETHSGYVPLWNLLDWRQNWGNLAWQPHVAADFSALRSDGLLIYWLAGLLPVASPAALKLVTGLGWLLGGTGLYLWLRSWLGPAGALTAA
jgi:hypothetical protein